MDGYGIGCLSCLTILRTNNTHARPPYPADTKKAFYEIFTIHFHNSANKQKNRKLTSL